MGLKPRELWGRFDWQEGNCFRCEQTGVPVADIGEITVAGRAFPLSACQWCVFRLEQLHYTMSERAVHRQNAPSSAHQWPTSAQFNRPPTRVA